MRARSGTCAGLRSPIGKRTLLPGMVLGLLLGGLLPARAESQHPTASLHYDPGSPQWNCIERGPLRTKVREHLGRDPFQTEDQATVHLHASIERSGNPVWIARVELRDAQGQSLGSRLLETKGPSCGALDRGLALVLALLVEHAEQQVHLQLPREPAPTPSKPAKTPSKPSDDTPPPTEQTQPRRWSYGLALGGRVSIAYLPEIAGGLHARALVEAAPLGTLELGAVLWPRADANVQAGGFGGEVSAWTVGLSACPRLWQGGAVSVSACAGIGAGSMRAQSAGFVPPADDRALLVDVTASGRLSWTVTPGVALQLGAGARFPLLSPRLTYAGPDGELRTAHEVPHVAGEAQLGLQVKVR